MAIKPQGSGPSIWRDDDDPAPSPEIKSKAAPRQVPSRAGLAPASQSAGDATKVAEGEGTAPGVVYRDVLLKDVPVRMLDRLEAERARRGLRSRAETIRVLLGEALGG